MEVFLGTNASPARKQSILNIPTHTAPRVYTYGSASVPLIAGRAYYFEVLHKEGGAADHLAIAWPTNDTTQPANSSAPIPGSVLSYIHGGQIEPRVVTSPADLLVALGGTATFSVNAGGARPLTYQWRKAGANIPGGRR